MAQSKATDMDATIKDLKRNIKMEAEDIVKAQKSEANMDHPKVDLKQTVNLEAKVNKVSEKFPEIMNLYNSLGWAKEFNPALEEAAKSFKDVLKTKD